MTAIADNRARTNALAELITLIESELSTADGDHEAALIDIRDRLMAVSEILSR